MTQILFSLMMISMVFNMFVRARASGGRINEVFLLEDTFLHETEAVPPPYGQETGRIDFEDVTFSYEGTSGEPVLKRINLTILPGKRSGSLAQPVLEKAPRRVNPPFL